MGGTFFPQWMDAIASFTCCYFMIRLGIKNPADHNNFERRLTIKFPIFKSKTTCYGVALLFMSTGFLQLMTYF